MQILNIPLEKRDYCAHYFRAIMLCNQQYWPAQYNYCGLERHAWEQCEYKRYTVNSNPSSFVSVIVSSSKLDDAKEYERELRLRRRRVRIEEKAARDSAHEHQLGSNDE
jgi:hypothetical protein